MVYTEDVLIIGGGQVGLVAQRHLPDAMILDWGPPPKHPTPVAQWGAIYWWEPIADIPCQSFEVLTTIDDGVPTPDAILAYKRRVGKGVEVQTRPDAVARQFQLKSKGYRPAEIVKPRRITYRAQVLHVRPFDQEVELSNGTRYRYKSLISTIPLPALLKMLPPHAVTRWDVPNLEFRSRPIYVSVSPGGGLPATYMHVNYLTGPTGAYRETKHLNGDVHREYSDPWHSDLPTRKLVPGRIYDHVEAVPLVEWLEDIGIHCFGRYARWDSDELLHMTDADLRDFAQGLKEMR